MNSSLGQHALHTVAPAPQVSQPMLQTEGLALAYGRQPAFAGVDLTVGRGQIMALMGPSGCGKSSFLSCLNRMTDLTPGCQVSGQVKVAGEAIYTRGVDVRALRRRVGTIFQKPTPFALSIQANIELPLREHGMRHAVERLARVEQVLTDVGLWDEVKDRLQDSALGLSGGQQQRLCIARALALQPEVLLMDEPCSALDPIASGVVESLITSLRGRYTLVVVTHNLAQARRIADDVALFWTQEGVGRLIESGPAQQVFSAPEHPLTQAYLTGAQG